MQQNIEDKLWRIFENVNKWLEYSERKNGVALVFIGVQLTILKVSSEEADCWMQAALVALGLCFFSTLLSFFPVTRISFLSRFCSNSWKKPSDKDNLLFFGHIMKYSHKAYLNAIGKYFKVDIQGQKILEDLCAQIVENSKITSRKFNIFKVTVCLMLAGQILLMISLVF